MLFQKPFCHSEWNEESQGSEIPRQARDDKIDTLSIGLIPKNLEKKKQTRPEGLSVVLLPWFSRAFREQRSKPFSDLSLARRKWIARVQVQNQRYAALYSSA